MKKTYSKRPTKAIRANEEVSTTDLLFEVQDVVDLLAEATGEEVEAEVADDGNSVDITVGEEVFNVAAEADSEVFDEEVPVEESRRVPHRPVEASRGNVYRKPAGRPMRSYKK